MIDLIHLKRKNYYPLRAFFPTNRTTSKKAMQCMKRSQIASQATILLTSKWKAKNSPIWLLVCMCSCEEQIIELKNYMLLEELWAILSGRYQYWCYIINMQGEKKKRKNLFEKFNAGDNSLFNWLSKACWQPVLRIQSHIN